MNKSERTRSFRLGGLTAAVFLGIGLIAYYNTGKLSTLGILAVAAVFGFTLVSCLCLDNNFIGDVMIGVFSWSFVQLPGLIFSLDLDGIVWFLTVKLVFWLLGMALALFFGALAIVLGAALSIFVYPFALHKSYTMPND